MPHPPEYLVNAAAEALIHLHWDGTGCGVSGDHPNACSHCFGPSPMSPWEVAELVLATALMEILKGDDNPNIGRQRAGSGPVTST